jgi:sec-independent protein translocase protein TatB
MLSAPHLIIVFIVVLIVFGPHKLPELARNLGKLLAEFRKASTDFKMAFEEEMRNMERQAREAEWKKTQAANAAKAETPTLPAATESPAAAAEQMPAEEASSSDVTTAKEPVIMPVAESVPRDGAFAPTVEPKASDAETDSQDVLHDHEQPA